VLSIIEAVSAEEWGEVVPAILPALIMVGEFVPTKREPRDAR